ncbi:PROTEIN DETOXIFICATION 44 CHLOROPLASTIC-RELATED [Salix purpurea]|uniref:Protein DETOXIFICATION n=1 Tax=Salix purpurea TaxID=77065 RepID=A0A9Q0SX64_SALPP|nr:PROTEIN DETOXIFICATION 44 CHLOROPLASTIC-RELATED [Salix purpurea]
MFTVFDRYSTSHVSSCQKKKKKEEPTDLPLFPICLQSQKTNSKSTLSKNPNFSFYLKFLKIQQKMRIKTLIHSSTIPFQNPNFKKHQQPSILLKNPPIHLLQSPKFPSKLNILTPRNYFYGLKANLSSQNQELFDTNNEIEGENDSKIGSILEEEEIEVDLNREGLENQSLWSQIKEIVVFTGPATGLWLCGPLMSLIDTVVIGQGSYIELAALGPATVLCDYMSYVFMFLSIATSNMVATYLARGDKNQVQHQISILLFVGMTCGLLMLVFTRFFGSWALTAFSGPKNAQILPAANTYVQIRGLAWPAVLVGWVAQSASLGMKDSWGPLKALAVSSVVNGVGDVVLCSFLGYGIAGAAWATMVSQVIAGYMMIEALNKKGYNAFAISVPTLDEILTIIGLAAPVFVTMISKVAFYSLMIYFATSMGTHSVAAHQVMLQIMGMCTVMGEPLSQTAQSFMPELIYGVNRSLKKARRLLKSLVTIGSTMGLLLGTIGTFAPWLFPNIFTRDQKVIQEVSSYCFTSISLFHYFYQELFVLPRYQKQWRNLERFPSLVPILTFIPLHGTTCNRT